MVTRKILFVILCLLVYSVALAEVSGTKEITLAWDANTEPGLAGYNIYWGTTSRDYSGQVDVSKQSFGEDCTPYDPFNLKCCEATLTGFKAGETYYFAATAYDQDDNEGAYSEELVHTFGVGTPISSVTDLVIKEK